MNNPSSSESDRRTFMKAAAGTMLAAGMTARSYARVMGANDRIRLAQLGCGGRSHGHVRMVQLASRQMPVETVAVCDIWSLARERRAAQGAPVPVSICRSMLRGSRIYGATSAAA